MQSKNKLQKLSQNYKIYILILILIFSALISYPIYLWINTQSTDNAYVDSNISTVSSEISGVIKDVIVKDNTPVKKGQIIALIDQEEYMARYNKSKLTYTLSYQNLKMIEQKIKLAKINHNKIEKSLDFAKTNLDLIQKEYDRSNELRKDNFVTIQLVDETKRSLEKAKNELIQAKLNMQTSKETIHLLEIEKSVIVNKLDITKQETIIAKHALDNTEIRSPIAGTISNSSLKIGNYVSPGSHLFSVIQLNDLYVKANFKETQISKFKSDMPVKLTFDSHNNITINGKIRNISPATGSKFSIIPPANATGNFTKIVQRVPVSIDFMLPNDLKCKILPGMSVFVKIRTDNFKK